MIQIDNIIDHLLYAMTETEIIPSRQFTGSSPFELYFYELHKLSLESFDY